MQEIEYGEEYRLLIYDNNLPYYINSDLYDESERYITLVRNKDGHWDYIWHIKSSSSNDFYNEKYSSTKPNPYEQFAYFKTDVYLDNLENSAYVNQINSFSVDNDTLSVNMDTKLKQVQADQTKIYKSKNKAVTIKKNAIESSATRAGATFQTNTNLSKENTHFSIATYMQQAGLPTEYQTSQKVANSSTSLTGQWKLTVGSTGKRYNYDNNVLVLNESKDGSIRGTSYISYDNIRYNLPVTGQRYNDDYIELEEYWTNKHLLIGKGTPQSVAEELVSYEPSLTIELYQKKDGTLTGTLENLRWKWNYFDELISFYNEEGDDITLTNQLSANDQDFLDKSGTRCCHFYDCRSCCRYW